MVTQSLSLAVDYAHISMSVVRKGGATQATYVQLLCIANHAFEAKQKCPLWSDVKHLHQWHLCRPYRFMQYAMRTRAGNCEADATFETFFSTLRKVCRGQKVSDVLSVPLIGELI